MTRKLRVHDRVTREVSQLRADPLVRNSFFLLATTGTTAFTGFVFWIIVARLFPLNQVGQGSSLLAVLGLLSYVSLFGMGSSMIKGLATSPRRSEHVSTSFVVVAIMSLFVALSFALIASATSPQLAFITASWANLATFVLLAMFAAVALLSNAVFVALRSAKFNLLINGILVGSIKAILPVFFVWVGAMGIYIASGLASAVAAVVSLILIRFRLRISLRGRINFSVLRDIMRFSLGAYVSGLFNLLPVLVVPVLVLDELGPEVAAGYFVAFQIATVVNAMSFAVGESMFAEGSHKRELKALAMRAGRIMAVLILPAVILVVAVAEPVLQMFGNSYVGVAKSTLIVLAVSSVAVGVHTWTSFLLKITGQLHAMVICELVFSISTIVLVVIAAGHGIVWIAVAWGAGNIMAGLVAVVALIVWRRQRPADALARQDVVAAENGVRSSSEGFAS